MTTKIKYISFQDYLKYRLSEPLPGLAAQLIVAPTKDGKPFRNFEPERKPHKSAVLVLLTELQNPYNSKDNINNISVVLTLRSETLINHRGQISFAGGRAEGNETSLLTALRETEEELGITKNRIQIVGNLSRLYVAPSNNLISPVIGFIENLDGLKINEDEVEEAFAVPLTFLSDERNLQRSFWKFGREIDDVLVPFWDIGKKTLLWGATAMMLMELIFLFREYELFKKF